MKNYLSFVMNHLEVIAIVSLFSGFALTNSVSGVYGAAGVLAVHVVLGASLRHKGVL